MNISFFIGKRLSKFKPKEKSLTKPIITIAQISILLSVAVMLLSVFILKGYQTAIRGKVIGFGAHIQIAPFLNAQEFDSSPFVLDSNLINSFLKDPAIKSVSSVAYKPAILTAPSQENKNLNNLCGVITKGIDSTFNFEFFEKNLVSGTIPKFIGKEIFVSEFIAHKLNLSVGDKVDAFFLRKSKPAKRKFKICGIFNTELSEIDKKMAFININHIKKINHWGIETQLLLHEKTNKKDQFIVEARLTDKNTKNYFYQWNNFPIAQNDQLKLNVLEDTTIRLIVREYAKQTLFIDDEEPISPNDTIYLNIKTNGQIISGKQSFELSAIGNNKTEYKNNNFKFCTKQLNTEGTQNSFIGGYEILVNNWDQLQDLSSIVNKHPVPITFEVKTITEQFSLLFKWMNSLDLNLYIILFLMIVVAIINMASTLIVMIIEKTNLIGILQALGLNNTSLKWVFLSHAFHLLTKGLIFGNILAISISLLQQKFHFFTLNPKTYNISYVPIEIVWSDVILINIGTIVTCILALLIPAKFATKVETIKAIKFD